MTNAELAILSLVVETPRHGYEIEQIIEERGMRDWTDIAFSSIYYLLIKLEEKNFIFGETQLESGPGPTRKIFEVTEEGRREHVRASLAAISEPPRASAPFLLGLASFPSLPRADVSKGLKEYLAKLSSSLAKMRESEEIQKPIPPFVEAMFSYSENRLQSEIQWISTFIQDLEAGNV